MERATPLGPEAVVAMLRAFNLGVEHGYLDPSPHNEAGAGRFSLGAPEQQLLTMARTLVISKPDPAATCTSPCHSAEGCKLRSPVAAAEPCRPGHMHSWRRLLKCLPRPHSHTCACQGTRVSNEARALRFGWRKRRRHR